MAEPLTQMRIFDGREGGAENVAHDLGERNAEQHAGLRAGDAGEEIFPAHAGIDDDGHGAELEEREGRGDERQALADHHEHAVAAPHARGRRGVRPRRRPRRRVRRNESVR